MFVIQACVALLVSQVAVQPASAPDILAPYRAAALERWEADIQKLEKRDAEETDPAEAILFIGSSSIRRWNTIAEDLAPWPTIERGYGGAKLSDLAVFVDRLVKPHQFRAVCVFVANDISGSESDKSPQEVLELYQFVVSRINQLAPGKPVFFIAITPTSSRFQVWSEIKEANTLIQRYCRKTEGLHFIATANRYLDTNGKPNDALFVSDKLHLNEDGYKIWAQVIKKQLAKVLGEASPQ